jgi:hypothetical protein
MAIFIPQRWKTQPQGNVAIDWSHPLACGLVYSQLPGVSRAGFFRLVDPQIKSVDFSGKLTNGIFTTTTEAATSGVGIKGRSSLADAAGTTNGSLSLYSVSEGGNPTYTYAGLFERRVFDTAQSSVATFAVNAGSNLTSITQNTGSSDSTFLTRFIDGSASLQISTALVNDLILDKKLNVVFSVYKNGQTPIGIVNNRQLTLSNNTVYDGAAAFLGGNYINSTGTYVGLGSFLWLRVLSTAEVAAFTENPWQIFKPKNNKKVFLNSTFVATNKNPFATDTFNYANGAINTVTTKPWQLMSNPGFNPLVVQNNKLTNGNSSPEISWMYYDEPYWTNNQKSVAKVSATPAALTNGCFSGVTVRTTGLALGYMLAVLVTNNAAENSYVLLTYADATQTTEGDPFYSGPIDSPVYDGDEISLEVVGYTLTARLNGRVICGGSVTDTNKRLSRGYPGVAILEEFQTGGATFIDDWSGYSLDVESTTVTPFKGGRFLPQRWKTQPQGNVEIDWSNPLCQNLLFAYLPGNPRSLAQRYMPQLGAGYFAARFNNSNVITRPGGRVSEFEEYNFISSIASGAFTFGMAGQLFGPVLASTQDIASISNGDTEVGVIVGYDTSASSFFVQTLASDDTFNSYSASGNVTAANLRSKTRFVAGTLSTTEVACWLAGTKLGFNTGGWNGTIPRALEIIVTSGYRQSGSSAPPTGFALAGFGWQRVLSPNELAILDENPWQIFKPKPGRTYFLPGITKRNKFLFLF